MKWLRRNGLAQITRNNMGSLRLTMRRRRLVYQPSGGRWSAQRGELRACFDRGGQAAGATSARYQTDMPRGGPMVDEFRRVRSSNPR